MRLPDPPLLLITDRAQARSPLADVIAQAGAGGCRWISVREKDLPPDAQIALAQELAPIARRFGATLTIHGDAALAQAAGLEGVHLPAGADAMAARAALGAGALIGRSIHSLGEVAALDPAALDYAIAGPAFATASKPGYGPALGREGLATLCHVSRVPVMAIGGIAPGNAREILPAGIAGIAVMGGVMRAPDPRREIEQLAMLL